MFSTLFHALKKGRADELPLDAASPVRLMSILIPICCHYCVIKWFFGIEMLS